MSEQKKYFLNKECFCQDIDDSLIILNSKTGQYHEINNSGKHIIKILDHKPLSLDEILEKNNQGKYKLKENTLIEFLGKLLEREIVTFTK